MFKALPLRIALQPSTQRVLSLTFVALVGFLWFAATTGDAELRWVSPSVLPSPTEVFGSIGSLVQDRALFASIAATLSRVVAGFLLAAIVAVPLAIYAASQRWMENFLQPLVVALRNVPVAALIPITLLWFGIEEEQKIMFIFLACFPFIFSDALHAILNVPERYVDTARTLGASDTQIVLKVLVPLALPAIYSSLRALFGLAFGYIMLAETINTTNGLGYLINTSQRRGLTEHVYLTLIVIGLLAWLIDWGLRLLEKRLFAYKNN